MKFTIPILLISIVCFSCEEPDSTETDQIVHTEEAPISSTAIKKSDSVSSQSLPSAPVFDTINQIILQRLTDLKIYSGEIRDTLYIFNGIYTYGLHQDWHHLFPIDQTHFKEARVRNPAIELDTIGIPLKESGLLSITPEISLRDDSIEDNLAIYQSVGFLPGTDLLIISKLGLHNTTYYSISASTNKIDTLGGRPLVFEDFLLCADLILRTDSRHEIKIFSIEENQLHHIRTFSTKLFFGIRPEKVWLESDRLLILKERNKEKYWQIEYQELSGVTE